jgi:hypothetical protein
MPQIKAPGELGSKTGRKLTARTHYAALTLFANIFGAVFWFVEQRRWRVADQLDNEGLRP